MGLNRLPLYAYASFVVLAFALHQPHRTQSYTKEISYNHRVSRSTFNLILRYAATAAAVAVIVFTYHAAVRVNPTTVALTFLIGVLIVSANWGLRPAVFMAVLATLAFNYYFLPPVRTLTI